MDHETQQVEVQRAEHQVEDLAGRGDGRGVDGQRDGSHPTTGDLTGGLDGGGTVRA